MIYCWVSGAGACLHLQHLNSLRQNELAVQTLGSEEADLTVAGVQLVQTLEAEAADAAMPSILTVTSSL